MQRVGRSKTWSELGCTHYQQMKYHKYRVDALFVL
jgi:hypothetical protein